MRCRHCVLVMVFAALVVAALGFSGVADAAQATLNWKDNSTNELGFTIERKSDPAGCAGTVPFVEIGTVGAGVSTYVDGTLVANTPYCYRVRAYNTVDGTATGTKQYSGYAGPTYYPFPVPADPSGLTAQ